MEKLISDLIISDMKHKFDPSQFGNQKGVSFAWFREYFRKQNTVQEFYRLEHHISLARPQTCSRIFNVDSVRLPSLTLC